MEDFKEIIKNNIKQIIMLLAIIIFSINIFSISEVIGESNLNTMESGDRILMLKKFGKPEKGKFYIFHYGEKICIKRCIATEGDRVKISDNNVRVNGELVDEHYAIKAYYKTLFEVDLVVPENKMYVLGDNRKDSFDSRFMEDPFIDYNTIVGES